MLCSAADGALQTLRATAERLEGIAPLIAAVSAAAQHVWENPTPYLAALDASEQAPATHAARTAMYALLLAAASGIKRTSARARVMLAAALADAGRWQPVLDDARRADPLSAELWAIMREHVERSAAMLLRTGVGSISTARAARHHHEWWDGGDYPDRRFHDAITIEARIIAIAMMRTRH